MLKFLTCGTLILGTALLVYSGDATQPGELMVEPATLHALGFEWEIQGDDNRNASVTVKYRQAGDKDWKTGLPFLPLGHEFADENKDPKQNYQVPRMFAGSIFDLRPGTEYDVQLTLKDPDGGEAVKTLKTSTKAEPIMYASGKKLHVYPAGFKGAKAEPAFDNLDKAFEAAQAGDQILVHVGIYTGSYVWQKGGQPGRPIVIQGAGDGEAILVNNKAQQMFNIYRADYLWFENLTFRDPGTGDGGNTVDGVVLLAGNSTIPGHFYPGCKGLVVQHCKFEDIGVGIMAADADCEGFVITDNRFLGRQDWRGPYEPPKGGPYDKYSWTSIWIAGRGHDIGYNQVCGFWDGIDILWAGTNSHYSGAQDSVAIDIYNNDISQTRDDFLETDFSAHNIRVLRNRCVNNATCGLSAQPVYGGPVYFIRNVLYNISADYGYKRQTAFKLECNPAGVIIYHNTVIGNQTDARYWSNCHWRNNLIMGNVVANENVLLTYTYTAHSTMDYDGFTAGKVTFLGPQTAMKQQTFSNLAEFSKATGLEKHGVTVDYGIFAAPPELPFGKNHTYKPEKVDLRLKPGGAAVDAGEVLPNINDEFTGKAPDLGAYEVDRPLPHYGPRP
jgi:hypothetical protein